MKICLEKMHGITKKINSLKQTDIRKLIDSRVKEFKRLGKKPISEIFNELCFCILTANYSAEGSIKIQCEIGDDFDVLSEMELASRLRQCGYRFPNIRAKYIVGARQKIDQLNHVLLSLKGEKLREWLVENIAGLGMKEASHFLRNIGYDNYAIIDFHIIDLLFKANLIQKPKTLTKKKYLEVENLLKQISEKSSLTLAELDLYLWYMEAGKVLK